jgi:hypothetical protein
VPSFMNFSVHSPVGIKSSVSIHKLVPVPNLSVLFVVSPLILLLLMVRFQKLLYPSVVLLLKQQFLFPIIFTSIFVSRASK